MWEVNQKYEAILLCQPNSESEALSSTQQEGMSLTGDEYIIRIHVYISSHYIGSMNTTPVRRAIFPFVKSGLLHLDYVSALPSRNDFLIVATRVLFIEPVSGTPAHPPSAGEELFHLLHGDTLRLGGPETQDDESRRTDHGPEDIGAVDRQANEHIGGDTDDGELEEPVE